MSPRAILPWVFFLSGLSSLVFQVSWQRLLTVWYGVGPVSMTLIVTVYMLGLGVGGYIGGILADRLRQRQLLYVFVEASLAVFGLFSLMYLNWLGKNTAGSDPLLALLCMALFLLLPTLAMGMTLPLVVKIFGEYDTDFLHSVSYLYSLNTLGAFTGALISSYLLISFVGIDGAIYIASGIDLLLAVAIFACRTGPATTVRASKEEPATPALDASTSVNGEPHASEYSASRGNRMINANALVALTGFLAIGYEMVWFRLVTLIVKPSAYTFSTTLAIYLFGLFAGSAAVNDLSSRGKIRDAGAIYFWLQVLTAVSVLCSVVTFFHLCNGFPPFCEFVMSSFSWNSPILRPFEIVLWPSYFMLIPTVLMGASFPLINYLGRSSKDKDGQTVGTLYLFNTLGNVLGGVVTGYFLLPMLGTELTLLAFIILGLIFVWWVPHVSGKNRLCIFAALSVVALIFMPGKGSLYQMLFTTLVKRDAVLGASKNKIYLEEGVDSVVATTQSDQYIQNFINGLTHGRRPDLGYYLEAIEAVSFHPGAKQALVIGFGTGSTVEALERMPTIEKITLVELSSANLQNLRKIEEIRKILEDKRLTVVVDDARRYLLATNEKYDLIQMDPLRPTEAYSNNIYSREFFQICSDHLKRDGILVVWLGEHEVIPKTIAAVFPYVRIYNFFGLGLASNSPLQENPERKQEAWAQFNKDERAVLEASKPKYLFDKQGLEKDPEIAKFPISEDARPVAEYYLGLMHKFRNWKPDSRKSAF
jgi:spermidine synthase